MAHSLSTVVFAVVLVVVNVYDHVCPPSTLLPHRIVRFAAAAAAAG